MAGSRKRVSAAGSPPPGDEPAARQVFDLAWRGEHEMAIEQATRALQAKGLTDPERLELLDLRSESLIAQGHLDRAAEEAAQMVKLAKAAKSDALLAQALGRQAVVQMRLGDHEAATVNAARSLKAARKCKSAALEALSLFRLAEAQFRKASSHEEAASNAARAARVYEELGDVMGQGRALWALAAARTNQGRAQESREAALKALALGRRCGDLYSAGNALNMLTFNEPDIAARLRCLNQALDAFETSGYLERQAVATNNLSLVYIRLGLYHRARRLARYSRDIYHRTASRYGFASASLLQASIELVMGHLDSARTLAREASALINQLQFEIGRAHV